MKRSIVVSALVATALGVLAGPVAAMSDGAYEFGRQGCTGAADNHELDGSTEAGCHNIQLTGEDGGGHRYAAVGTDQTPDGTNVHSGSVSVDPGAGQACGADFDAGLTNGVAPGAPAGGCSDSAQAAPDPATGGGVYFGADDNLDSGEHDSSAYSDNGPSDGGGIRAAVDPATATRWVDALSAADIGYLLAHPTPLGYTAVGACADGVCLSVQGQRQAVFQGDGHGERDVYDYGGKTWDPYTCGGPTDQRDACGGHTLDKWNKGEGTVYAQPGVQVYEDPDPQGSPIDPLYDAGATGQPTIYPIPSVYAGTCGVMVGGGPLALPAGTPLSGGEGQAGVSTGC